MVTARFGSAAVMPATVEIGFVVDSSDIRCKRTRADEHHMTALALPDAPIAYAANLLVAIRTAACAVNVLLSAQRSPYKNRVGFVDLSRSQVSFLAMAAHSGR